MSQFFKTFFKNFNIVLEKNKVIANILTYLFDSLSRFTHFFLFNLVGFSVFMLFLFVFPVADSEEFIKLIINLVDHLLNLKSSFNLLPLGS
jgi:predicted PurR-regulated permease PerM